MRNRLLPSVSELLHFAVEDAIEETRYQARSGTSRPFRERLMGAFHSYRVLDETALEEIACEPPGGEGGSPERMARRWLSDVHCALLELEGIDPPFEPSAFARHKASELRGEVNVLHATPWVGLGIA